jgi:hypothetical protein
VDQIEKEETKLRRERSPEKLLILKSILDKKEVLINSWEDRLPIDFIKMERSGLGITRFNYGLK